MACPLGYGIKFLRHCHFSPIILIKTKLHNQEREQAEVYTCNLKSLNRKFKQPKSYEQSNRCDIFLDTRYIGKPYFALRPTELKDWGPRIKAYSSHYCENYARLKVGPFFLNHPDYLLNRSADNPPSGIQTGRKHSEIFKIRRESHGLIEVHETF